MVFGVTFVPRNEVKFTLIYVNIQLLLWGSIFKSPNFTIAKNKAQCFFNMSYCLLVSTSTLFIPYSKNFINNSNAKI